MDSSAGQVKPMNIKSVSAGFPISTQHIIKEKGKYFIGYWLNRGGLGNLHLHILKKITYGSTVYIIYAKNRIKEIIILEIRWKENEIQYTISSLLIKVSLSGRYK